MATRWCWHRAGAEEGKRKSIDAIDLSHKETVGVVLADFIVTSTIKHQWWPKSKETNLGIINLLIFLRYISVGTCLQIRFQLSLQFPSTWLYSSFSSTVNWEKPTIFSQSLSDWHMILIIGIIEVWDDWVWYYVVVGSPLSPPWLTNSQTNQHWVALRQ